MPSGRAEGGTAGSASGGGGGAPGRTSFRPPWVRDGPNPLPMPAAPWTLKRPSGKEEAPAVAPEGQPPRKTSTVKIVPVQPTENGTPKDPHTFEIPKLREVPKQTPKENTRLQSREVKVPVVLNSPRRDSRDLPVKVQIESRKKDEPPGIPKVELKPVKRDTSKKNVTIDDKADKAIDRAVPAERNAIVRQESMKKLSPVPPPMPPPPPPPPQLPFEKRESLTRQQLEKIESLRSRPRKRPDWGAMMKDIECGKKLKHVQCNDRSQPMLPHDKAKGQFIYESEKANLHNQLLKQIQTGANLKHVKTNDRSKPILEGLRKFRRQMTIEEQIQKSQSIAMMPEAEVEEEVDEMDDIDKVRDDLQSTKQMLALELRNKEAQIRENKRLQARLQYLEAELEKAKAQPPSPAEPGAPAPAVDDKIVTTLKEEATQARKIAEDMEKKFHDTADQLDVVKTDLDEARRQNQILEKKLQQAMQGAGQKRQSVSDRRESVPGKDPPPEEEDSEEESETESESGDEDNEEKQKRRAERELRLLRNKLKSYKNKLEAARRERKNLRDQIKKNQQIMKEEKKKYRRLQKEVNKMAALMKEDDEDEEDEDEKEEVEEEETESEESESESESETSEEEESSESEDEDTPIDEQKENLQTRVKRHENCLNALKKGNYMLKANVDRLQDDLNKQKDMVTSLQEDLDSVLSELG